MMGDFPDRKSKRRLHLLISGPNDIRHCLVPLRIRWAAELCEDVGTKV